MSLLPDHEIQREIEHRRLSVTPYDATMVQPASLDVRLDRHFATLVGVGVVDPRIESTNQWSHSETDDKLLEPGEFVLASTYERVTLPDYISARFEGKSSLGRLGLLTHITAGFIDPGFSGHITLELSNVTQRPILLRAGMKIGQLCFMRMSSSASMPYGSAAVGSHYQGQRGPTLSRIHENFHQTKV